jgi:hypothetical protein
MEELQCIEKKSFSMSRLELAKDLFLLQCYSGLSYVDLVGLKWKNIVKGGDGIFGWKYHGRRQGLLRRFLFFL